MESKKDESTYFINLNNLIKYEEKGVYFSKPRLLAFYDYNYGKITKARRINYFQNPTLEQYPLNLNINVEKYIQKSRVHPKKIDISLKYIMDSGAMYDDDIKSIYKTKVITSRGTLVRIMESFYNKNFGDITICVSRYNGNLYMRTEDKDESFEELTPAQMHHRRLQQLLFSDSPNEPTNSDELCDENIELVGVHRSNFGKFDVIYSGKLQGIDSDNEIKDFNDFEELNNCRYVFAKQMWYTLKHKDNKYLKFWLQSYLANVRDIYIAYKVDGFIIDPIKHKKVANLPENRFWKPSMCTGFLYEFLLYVEREMSSINCLDTVYTFHYNPKLNAFKCESFKGFSNKTFISKDYKDYCNM